MSTLTAPLAANAFNTLYQTHHRWLRHWLQHKLGSSCDADDLAQDTFVRVLLGGSAQDIREPKSFLCTVARRVMVDFFRRNALERAWLEMLEQLPEAQVPSPNFSMSCWKRCRKLMRCSTDSAQKCARRFCCRSWKG